MPNYSFTCVYCGWQGKISLPVAKRDSAILCQNQQCLAFLRRQPDAPAFHLKGGGWTPKGK